MRRVTVASLTVSTLVGVLGSGEATHYPGGGGPGENWREEGREGGGPSRVGVPSSAALAASGLLQG